MLRLPLSTPDSLNKKQLDYLDLIDEQYVKQFRHIFDYFINQKGELNEYRSDDIVLGGNFGATLLGSFVRTFDHNEDPTVLGFDLKINVPSSPIFNGELLAFLETWSSLGNSEVASRLEILGRFQEQLFKFMKKDVSVQLGYGLEGDPKFLGKDGPKSYYIEELQGLEKLSESFQGSTGESGNLFADYPKDMITIKFREDVTQSLGYLSSLYKSLSWSRINGKLVVPENLLRFDCEIEITEIRDYMRLFNNNGSLESYVDKISRYVYKLYECQFFFTSFPHGDSINMTETREIGTTDIKFNYKFSTMKFEKFTVNPDSPSQKNSTVIDNKMLNPLGLTPENASTVNTNQNTITLEKVPVDLTLVEKSDRLILDELSDSNRAGDLENLKAVDKLNQLTPNNSAIPDDLPVALADNPLFPNASNPSFSQDIVVPNTGGQNNQVGVTKGSDAFGRTLPSQPFNFNVLAPIFSDFGVGFNLNNLGGGLGGSLRFGQQMDIYKGNYSSTLVNLTFGKNLPANLGISTALQSVEGFLGTTFNINNLGQKPTTNFNLATNFSTAIGNFLTNLSSNNSGTVVTNTIVGSNISPLLNEIGVGGNTTNTLQITPRLSNPNNGIDIYQSDFAGAVESKSTNNLGQQIPSNNTPSQINSLKEKIVMVNRMNVSNELRSQMSLIDKTLSNFRQNQRGETNLKQSIKSFVGPSLRDFIQ